MKVLLVAPELCPPWTEGRKRLARDLAGAFMEKTDTQAICTVLPGTAADLPCPTHSLTANSGAGHLTGLLRLLVPVLRRFRPDVVFHLPYGTFRGLRGTANDASMALVDRLARATGAKCGTVMFSMDEHRTPAQLSRRVSHLLLPPGPDWNGPRFSLGLQLKDWPAPKTAPARRLLFMAGMWQTTGERLDHVLETRGLGTLLRAGRALSDAGVQLTIASPVLRDAELARQLRGLPVNLWPESALTLRPQVAVPEIFDGVGLFVFPYGRDITRFTPTSVLEALASGVPVLLSDVPFLRRLAAQTPGTLTFANGDADALARTALRVLDDSAEQAALSRAGRAHVASAHAIENTVVQLLEATGFPQAQANPAP